MVFFSRPDNLSPALYDLYPRPGWWLTVHWNDRGCSNNIARINRCVCKKCRSQKTLWLQSPHLQYSALSLKFKRSPAPAKASCGGSRSFPLSEPQPPHLKTELLHRVISRSYSSHAHEQGNSFSWWMDQVSPWGVDVNYRLLIGLRGSLTWTKREGVLKNQWEVSPRQIVESLSGTKTKETSEPGWQNWSFVHLDRCTGIKDN